MVLPDSLAVICRFQAGEAGSVTAGVVFVPVYRLMMRGALAGRLGTCALNTAKRTEPSRWVEISSACKGTVLPLASRATRPWLGSQSPRLNGWPKVTGTPVWALALVSSTQVMAPVAHDRPEAPAGGAGAGAGLGEGAGDGEGDGEGAGEGDGEGDGDGDGEGAGAVVPLPCATSATPADPPPPPHAVRARAANKVQSMG